MCVMLSDPGADGCRWFDNENDRINDYPAIPTDVVDTTGAGTRLRAIFWRG